MLILRKADLRFSNAKKQTPLHFVAHAGLHDAAACLLETFQNSALDFEDATGHSPLLYAAKSKVKSIHSFLQGFKTEAKPEVETTQYPAEKDKQTAVPAVDLQPAQGQTEKEPLQTPQTKCPEGHDLIPFESEEDDFLCSVCECEFPMGTILYGCRACDYDLCRECLAHTVFHSSGKSFVAAFPEMQTFQSFGGSNKSLLQGLVLDDRIYLDLFGSIRSAFNLRFSPLQPLVHSIWHHLASFEFMWHWELMPNPGPNLVPGRYWWRYSRGHRIRRRLLRFAAVLCRGGLGWHWGGATQSKFRRFLVNLVNHTLNVLTTPDSFDN